MWKAVKNGLIEAYWNVNHADLFAVEGEQTGLIEAYWNVNCGSSRLNAKKERGLIEAYWNVNNLANAITSNPIARFNRSILKCKYLLHNLYPL